MDTTRCARHPDVETNLRCSKCGTLICPKCLVQAPVGVRCPACAKLYRLPTFRVSGKYYLRAIGTGLAMAVVGGIVWRVVMSLVPFLFLNLLLAAGAGYAIGEVISLSVNRKRGPGLAVVGGVAVALSYAVSFWFASLLLGIPFQWVFHLGLISIAIDLLALGLGVFVAVTRLR